MNDAMDLTGGLLGTIAGAAAANQQAEADRRADAEKCWTENRRIKSGAQTVVKKVRVCSGE
ncbi:hypothetical protein GCM10008179_00140 [Hansschlegelia plantiphila]|uniref:Uncharacterized protein n=1 Tax=Hansschlegelia plantiphila TaxID=374655 RepID=A0A9W6IWE3_9HYPH|nr:hypothetical protein GCM10008179_00140 [Hansschlegelia plantiphila]